MSLGIHVDMVACWVKVDCVGGDFDWILKVSCRDINLTSS